MFRLQQFAIAQDKCAMKVCTDALIFGAMAPIKPESTVLDIGAGTGILSLMAIQQGAAHVTAVELLQPAANQAQQNVHNSPWPQQVTVIQSNITAYNTDQRFDLIMSNPPFFDNHLKNGCSERKTARHTDTLSYQQLLTCANQWLAPNGRIYVLVPLGVRDRLIDLAKNLGLSLDQQTNYMTKVGGKAKLCALTFAHTPNVVKESSLIEVTIYDSHQQYTTQSSEILAKYLLRFATSH